MTEEQLQAIIAQSKHLAMLLTAIIKKYGKEDILYAAGKAPGIELVLTEEDLAPAKSGAWHCIQEPGKEKGSIVLKLARTPVQKH